MSDVDHLLMIESHSTEAMAGSALRRQFLEHFRDNIIQAELPVLRAAWRTQSARTAFYEKMLTNVARAMDMTLERELLIVDFALISPKDLVPQIFVESENIATSAVHEVRKLCCLAAPLKILLAVCSWDETAGVWPRGPLRPQVLNAWRHEVALHAAAGSLVGEIVAVVAEWRHDQTLRFYSVDLRAARALDDIFINHAVPGSTV